MVHTKVCRVYDYIMYTPSHTRTHTHTCTHTHAHTHTHTHTPPHQPCLSSHIECSDTSAVCRYLYFPAPRFSIIDPDHPIGKATNEQTAPETQAQARCTTGAGERVGKVTMSCCRLLLVSPSLVPRPTLFFCSLVCVQYTERG